ncbi:hypothetical protein RhiirC2_721793 [Rhizophagus irregularis]|uniref:Uncharacterized protein n=1 Tax=Rhizophagus irregularis TaxID=588596 RepID=A0A2N1M4K0_9GLOM|nr:hypothetical protein RhiirC2_721793 [Rhizophagus irregularis]
MIRNLPFCFSERKFLIFLIYDKRGREEKKKNEKGKWKGKVKNEREKDKKGGRTKGKKAQLTIQNLPFCFSERKFLIFLIYDKRGRKEKKKNEKGKWKGKVKNERKKDEKGGRTKGKGKFLIFLIYDKGEGKRKKERKGKVKRENEK